MKKSTWWPIGIIGVLAVTVGVNLFLFHVAGDDPSMVIEPNYYAKAVAWDSTLAQDKRNVALGWRLSPSLDAFSMKEGARLTVTLVDSTGRPIPGATVKVSALYNARADRILESTLSPAGSRYEAKIKVDHGGQWELRFDVTRGADRFTATTRIDAVSASPGA